MPRLFLAALSLLPRAAPFVALALAAGCAPPASSRLTGTAHDEWTRSYTLAEGGQVEIDNPEGAVDVQAAAGDEVEVRAERIVRALSDASAAEILPRIAIKEETAPGKVSVRTQPLGGIVIGVEVEVRYHVRAPKSAVVRVRARGGPLHVSGFSGRVVLNGANGGLTAEGLSGGVEARWGNGPVTIALESVGSDPIDVRVTNGGLTLTVPATANANLNASAANGTVALKGLTVEAFGDQSSRRVRGRLNAGGTPIELASVNGSIVVETAEP